jgi:hypothetical protein
MKLNFFSDQLLLKNLNWYHTADYYKQRLDYSGTETSRLGHLMKVWRNFDLALGGETQTFRCGLFMGGRKNDEKQD